MLDGFLKPIHAGGEASILIFYTVEPWAAEVGEAVVRALRDRYWHWNGLVVNLRPDEDVAALGPEAAHILYQALHARFGPDSGHTCSPECGAACGPPVV